MYFFHFFPVFHVLFWTSSFPKKNGATKNNQLPHLIPLLVARKPSAPGIHTMVAQQTYRSSWDSISSCFGAMGTAVELGDMTFIHYTNLHLKMINPVHRYIIFRGELLVSGKGIQSFCKWSFVALCEVFKNFLLNRVASSSMWHIWWNFEWSNLFKFILGLKFFRMRTFDWVAY